MYKLAAPSSIALLASLASAQGSLPVRFADLSGLSCGGDAFNPSCLADGQLTCNIPFMCDDLPDTLLTLQMNNFDCPQNYEGEDDIKATLDPGFIATSGVTGSGVGGFEELHFDSTAMMAATITQTGFRSTTARYEIHAAYDVTCVGGPELPEQCCPFSDDCGVTEAHWDTGGTFRLLIALDEPLMLVERTGPATFFSAYQIGDIIPPGQYTFFHNFFYGGAPSPTDPTVFGDSVDITAVLEAPDCDGNGINDLTEPDSDGNGTTDACEPIQNVSAGTGYARLEHALAAASSGDVIQLPPGESFVCNSLISGINLYLVGAPDGTSTLIDDCGGRVLTIDSGQAVSLQNITFANGQAPGATGGNLLVLGGTADFSGCEFIGGTALDGGSVSIIGGAAVGMVDCTLVGGQAVNAGGSILLDTSILSATGLELRHSIAGTSGGAIAAYNNSFINISDALILGSIAGADGGGINVDNSELDAHNLDISGCTATFSGGGIAASNATVILEDSSLNANEAQIFGGGASLNASSAAITNCLVFTNTSAGNGGGIRADSTVLVIRDNTRFEGNAAISIGGGLAMQGEAGILDVQNAQFIENTSDSAGGGIYLASASSVLRDTLFEANEAALGGGINLTNAPMRLIRCALIGNRSSGNGGAMDSTFGADLNITDSVIALNVADGVAGGLSIFQSDATIVNTTITGNLGSTGSGLTVWGVGESTATVRSTIIHNNLGNEVGTALDGPNTIDVAYSIIQDGWPGTNVLDTDPRFVDPVVFGGSQSLNPNRFMLQPGSPAIDRGDLLAYGDAGGELFDLALNFRLRDDLGRPNLGTGNDAFLDLGAFEFQGTSPCTLADLAEPYGTLNNTDINAFITRFLQSDPLADLNTDGQFNNTDINLFVSAFLSGCD